MKKLLTCCFHASCCKDETDETAVVPSVFGPEEPPPAEHVTGIDYITSLRFVKRFAKGSFTGGDLFVKLELNQFLENGRDSYPPYTRFKAVFDALKASRPELDTIGDGSEDQGGPELMFLWHGTKEANVGSIMKHGFLAEKTVTYGWRKAFWFSPDITFARMYDGVQNMETRVYTLVLCAVLDAQQLDEHRFVVPHVNPENILPLAAVQLRRKA